MPPLLQSTIKDVSCRRGKVRDVYDLGDRLVIVATDRLSAFDWVLPTGIPDKGQVLTALTLFWLDLLKVPNHLLSADVAALPPPFAAHAEELHGRTMLVRKTAVVPVECVVRGYLTGSGWKEYQALGTVCGIALPPGLRQAEQLPEPIFTPATKEESGHDQNISFDQMATLTGAGVAEELRQRSLDVYRRAAEHARGRGILLADTKFEWGQLPGGDLILIDEVLTPDSSRFWPVDGYTVGGSPPSFDKQFVRDWLEASGWDKNSPPPPLPDAVVFRTRAKYDGGSRTPHRTLRSRVGQALSGDPLAKLLPAAQLPHPAVLGPGGTTGIQGSNGGFGFIRGTIRADNKKRGSTLPGGQGRCNRSKGDQSDGPVILDGIPGGGADPGGGGLGADTKVAASGASPGSGSRAVPRRCPASTSSPCRN